MKRSLGNRIDRYAQAHAPKPAEHLIWTDWWGPSFEEKRDAWIASGEGEADRSLHQNFLAAARV